jgi:hypothetical protein
MWIDLIMKCITTVYYSILINGNPMEDIQPFRVFQQGDPLSPYLFLICAKALSSLLHRANYVGDLVDVPTSVGGPKVNHLFFANDSLLFCKANKEE